MNSPLLVYGGTFDPVHAGHVAIARAAADCIAAERALLVPCGDPPHRSAAQASGAQRAAMLRLAFADDARFAVDERELQRGGPSYTVDTLRDLRSQLGSRQSLVLLLGVDAANGLPGWHQPQALPALAHLLVFARPGVALDPAIAALGWHWAANPAELAATPAGACWRFDAPLSALSSTAIRAALAAGTDAVPGLPAAVAAHIAAQRLYR